MCVGIGIFGSGNLSQFVVKCLTQNGIPVEGIWDLSKEIAQQASILLKIPFFTDSIDSLLLNAKVSLVVILCPPHFHHQIITKALRIGKHVISDNLIASPKELKEIIFASNYYPSLISLLSHPFRFLATFKQVRDLVLNGSIGSINLINANVNTNCFDLSNLYGIRCDEWMGGGLLQTNGVHFIDIIIFITNLKVKKVHGILRKFKKFQQNDQNDNHTLRIDDFCSFQMEMINGQVSSLNSYTTSSSPLRPSLSTSTSTSSTTTSTSTSKSTSTSTSTSTSILANVTITSYLLNQYSYEIIIIGTLGYLAIRDNQLYIKKFDPFHKINDGSEQLLLEEEYDYSLPSSDYLPKSYTQGLTQMIIKLKKAFEIQNQCSKCPIIKNESKNKFKDDSNLSKIDQESLNQKSNTQISNGSKNVPWYKDIFKEAATFDDGCYIQSVVQSIRSSSINKEWVRVIHK